MGNFLPLAPRKNPGYATWFTNKKKHYFVSFQRLEQVIFNIQASKLFQFSYMFLLVLLWEMVFVTIFAFLKDF